jgi:hypothetical protein
MCSDKRCSGRRSDATAKRTCRATKENENQISTGVFLGTATFANLLFRQRATRRRATLAQLVEQLIRNQQVAGSNPAGGSNEFNGLERARQANEAALALKRMTLSPSGWNASLVSSPDPAS